MSTSILTPPMMRIGAEASMKLPEVLQQLALRRPLIITGPVVVKYGYLERVTQTLESGGISYGVFAGVPSDPTDETVDEALAQLSMADYDCVVGLGGGSPMDTAKIVSVMGVNGGRVRDYAAPVDNCDAGLPVIAIPTTAGTGSEATRVTIITDTANDEKLLCIGSAFMPAARTRYPDCARQMGMVPAGANDVVSNRILIEELQRLNEDLRVPSPMEYGIDRREYTQLMPAMAEQALASGSPANNPVIPDSDQIVELYKSVYASSTTVSPVVSLSCAGVV